MGPRSQCSTGEGAPAALPRYIRGVRTTGKYVVDDVFIAAQ